MSASNLNRTCRTIGSKGEGSPLAADVIEWLQNAGRGYQTRMNSILREAMLHSET